MKKLILIIISLMMFACEQQEKSELELTLLSKEINCLKVNPVDYWKFINTTELAPVSSKTILKYKLENHSDKTYYLNIDNYNEDLENNNIKADKIFLLVSDSSGNFVNAKGRQPTSENFSNILILQYLNQKSLNLPSKNFIIHPKETLYFEWFTILPFGNILETTNYQIKLNYDKTYFSEIVLVSDSTNYKNKISVSDLKTIKQNHYNVFHGKIKSVNKVPIVFKNISQ